MVQARDGPRLALESLAKRGVSREVLGQNFDRDRAIESSVFGFVDFPHAARADRGQNFIGTESTSGFYGHK